MPNNCGFGLFCLYIDFRGHAKLNLDKPYHWNENSVVGILEREEYLGRTFTLKTSVVSFKSKKPRRNAPETWLRFDGTHEALVDIDTWEAVQRVRNGKRRPTAMGEQDVLAGLVFCADCGSKHYFRRCGSWKPEQFDFARGTYHKQKQEGCTPHTIKVNALHNIVLTAIRNVSEDATVSRDAFLQKMIAEHDFRSRQGLSTKRQELNRILKRLLDLDNPLTRTCEDYVVGDLSANQFRFLSAKYDTEKLELTQTHSSLEQEISDFETRTNGVDRFLEVVAKFKDIQALTAEIVRAYIERIVVHERSEPRKRTNYTQKVDVYFNFIGLY